VSEYENSTTTCDICEGSRVTGSITPFWDEQKADFIQILFVTIVKIMLRFHDEHNPNKRQTIG
jgi:hypothetical protein